MITVPFDKRTFSTDCKAMLSGANLTLDFDNLQSTMARVAVDMQSVLGAKLYEDIVGKTAVKEQTDDLEDYEQVKAYLDTNLLDDLKRAMLHFTVYHHVIYFIARISNDGIMVRKDDNMTTIFRYQQQELQAQLLNDGWFWVDHLLDDLREFSKYIVHAQDAEQMPVTVSDFAQHVGINSSSFVAQVKSIITEVWRDMIESIGANEKTDDIARAVCYEVVARCCVRLPYHMLPEPLRVNADNEQSKEVDRTTYIRTQLHDIYHLRATAYMEDVRRKQQTEAAAQTPAESSIYKRREDCHSDKFAVL